MFRYFLFYLTLTTWMVGTTIAIYRSVLHLEWVSIGIYILFCCCISGNRHCKSAFICHLSHRFCCYHGNMLVSMATGISGFCSHPLWTLLAHFLPNQYYIWELRRFFHHHSNRYQGNQTLVFFLLLGSHGPSSCQISSKSEQNWKKIKDSDIRKIPTSRFYYKDSEVSLPWKGIRS